MMADRAGEVVPALLRFLDAHPVPPASLPEGEGEAGGITYRIRGSGPPLVLMPLDLAPGGSLLGQHEQASDHLGLPAEALPSDLGPESGLHVVTAERFLDRCELGLHLDHEERACGGMPPEQIDRATRCEQALYAADPERSPVGEGFLWQAPLAALCFILFVLHERRTPRPLIDIRPVLGAVSALQEVGSVLGPLWGGLITASTLGWTWIFWINIPVAALLMWALCIVCAIRASARRRLGATIAYVLGALPGTVALAALIWVTS